MAQIRKSRILMPIMLEKKENAPKSVRVERVSENLKVKYMRTYTKRYDKYQMFLQFGKDIQKLQKDIDSLWISISDTCGKTKRDTTGLRNMIMSLEYIRNQMNYDFFKLYPDDAKEDVFYYERKQREIKRKR